MEIQTESIVKEKIYSDIMARRIDLAVGKECPLCLAIQDREIVGVLRKRIGPYGEFLSCSNYPGCKFTWSEQNPAVLPSIEK